MFCTSSMSFGYSFIFIENWALHSKSYCNDNWTALTLGACENILVCQIFSLVANVRAVKVQLLYDLECNIFVFVLYLYFNHILSVCNIYFTWTGLTGVTSKKIWCAEFFCLWPTLELSKYHYKTILSAIYGIGIVIILGQL